MAGDECRKEKLANMVRKSSIERIHCNTCGGKRDHLVVATREQRHSETFNQQFDVDWVIVYDMLECAGCKEICVRKKVWCSEDAPYDGPEITYYPPRIERRLPEWKDALPTEMAALVVEVYAALQADSRSLAAMGARALIDMVIVKEVGDAGSFPQKLSALQEAGFLSTRNREVLEAVLDLGSAAAHRGYRPERDHLEAAIDIVENLLQATTLRKFVRELRRKTPRRSKRKKRKGASRDDKHMLT